MKKKEKLIKTTVVFLVLMAVFTILSRATDNLTIASVTTQRVQSMQIDHSLSVTGQVQENKNILISTVAGLKIQGVYVTEGQRVEQGAVLFSVDTSELTDKISKLESSIQKADAKTEQLKTEKLLILSRAQEDYNTAVSDGDRSIENAYNAYSRAVDAYNTYVTTHTEIAPNTTSDESTTDTSKYYSEEQANSLQDAVDLEKVAYDNAVTAKETAVTSAKRAVEDAQNAIDSQTADNAESGTEGTTDGQTNQEKLDKLKELRAAGGEITAPQVSVVTKVSVAAGDETTDGTAVMIADESAGCMITVQMSKDYQKYVISGNTVTLSGTGTDGKEMTVEDAVITAVSLAGGASDASSADTSGADTSGDMLDVTIQMQSAALQIRSSVVVKMDNKSENYPLCIPISALHQDNKKQYFVLIPEEKQSVLGTELIAQKVAVTVLDRNASYAAIKEGSITKNQYIITESTKDIEEGSRIKLQEL